MGGFKTFQAGRLSRIMHKIGSEGAVLRFENSQKHLMVSTTCT